MLRPKLIFILYKSFCFPYNKAIRIIKRNGEQVLAVVAGKEITQEDFAAFAQTIPQDQQAYLQNPDARKYYEEQLIAIYLFAQLGKDEKLDETQEFKIIIENAKRDVLGQLAMRNVLSGIDVSDDEIKAYYEENKANFQKAGTVQAKHILMDAEDAVKDVLAKIKSGVISFEDAAKEHSTCPSKERGGDLGEFGHGQMVKEFEDAAFSAEIGEVTEPVKTQFGYHLIKVEGRKEPAAQTFEDVASTIRTTLIQQKQKTVYDAKIAELKAQYCK